MDNPWVVAGIVVLLVAFVAIVWFFFDTGTGDRSDDGIYKGWRERKAESTSYSEMAEYRDSLDGCDQECSTRETPFRRLVRWWKS